MTSNSQISGDRFLPTSEVCRRYHVCDRTIERWLADDRLGFPKPMVVNRRRYWSAESLHEFERRLPVLSRQEAAGSSALANERTPASIGGAGDVRSGGL